MPVSDAEFAQLQAQVQQLLQQNRELALGVESYRQQYQDAQIRAAPPERRAELQAQLERQAAQESLLDTERRLDAFALQLNARKLSLDTGLSEAEIGAHDSIQGQNQFVLGKMQEMLRNPEAVRLLSQRLNGDTAADPTKAGTGAQTTEPGNAAGAGAAPVGAPTNGNAAAVQPSPTETLLADKNYGRGTGNVEEYLAHLRSETPMQDLVFGGEPTGPLPGVTPATQSPQSNAGASAPSSQQGQAAGAGGVTVQVAS